MNKETAVALLAASAAGYVVGTVVQHNKTRKRIAKWQPLMANAFMTMLLKIHSNPDISAEEIREQGELEVAFMAMAMKN